MLDVRTKADRNLDALRGLSYRVLSCRV